MRHTLALAAALMLSGSAALAQIGNPAGVEPGTKQSEPGVPAPHQTNTQDQLFAQQAAIGGQAEVALGRLAERKAQNSLVREFAKRMANDHGQANASLTDLAKSAKIPLPSEPDPEHKAVQEKLEALSGAEFDLAYLAAQTTDHQKSVQLLLWEINSGQDAQLQQFASRTLPVVLSHLKSAQDIMTQLTGQAPRELAPTSGASSDAPPARPPSR